MSESLDFRCKSCGGSGSRTCSSCGGSGSETVTCGSCGGAGEFRTAHTDGYGNWRDSYSTCGTCGGRGEFDVSCSSCGGRGSVGCSACGGTGEDTAAKEAYFKRIEQEKKEKANLADYILDIDEEKLKRYIQEGLALNHQNSKGETSLLACIKNNKATKVNILLSAGANINMRDNEGGSPLYYSIANKQENTAKTILDLLTVVQDPEMLFILAMKSAMPEIAKTIYKKNGTLIFKPEDALEMLISSAKEDDIEIAQIMLKTVNINANEGNQYTALSAAVENNSKNMIDFLLKNGANPNAKTQKGFSLIITAANEEKEGLARALINKGAAITLEANQGTLSALDLFISKNQKKLAQDIINANLVSQEVLDYAFLTMLNDKDKSLARKYASLVKNVNCFKKKNETAVLKAIESKDKQLIGEVLKKENLLLDIKNESGYSPLEAAIENNDLETTRNLIALGASLSFADSNKYPLPLTAIEQKNIEMLRFLEENGIEILRTNTNGESELVIAVKKANKEIIDYLLDRGANVNKVDNKGNSILIEAIKNKCNISIIITLLKHGAQLDHKTDDQKTALLLACENDDLELAKYILKQDNSLINIKSLDNRTPLKEAIKNRSLELLKLLVQNNADVNCSVGLFPIEEAVKQREISIVKILIEAGTEVNPDLKEPLIFTAISLGTVDIVKLLLEKGMNPNALSKDKGFPLFYSLMTKREEIVDILLNHDVDLTMKDTNGDTVLFYAIKSNITKYIEKFANEKTVNIKNANEKTPIFYAIEENNIETVKLLLSKKADLSIKDKQNRTPLMHAVVNRSWEIVDLLSEIALNFKDQDINGDNLIILSIRNKRTDSEIEFIKKLIIKASKQEINLINNRKENALIVATEKGEKELVEFLLRNKANKKQERDDRRRALDIAIDKNYHEIRAIIEESSQMWIVVTAIILVVGAIYLQDGLKYFKETYKTQVDTMYKDKKDVKNTMAHLRVVTNVKKPIIKIMNIKPRFSQGILLNKGSYDIQVSKKGYHTYRKWIKLDKDRTVNINLKPLK